MLEEDDNTTIIITNIFQGDDDTDTDTDTDDEITVIPEPPAAGPTPIEIPVPAPESAPLPKTGANNLLMVLTGLMLVGTGVTVNRFKR